MSADGLLPDPDEEELEEARKQELHDELLYEVCSGNYLLAIMVVKGMQIEDDEARVDFMHVIGERMGTDWMMRFLAWLDNWKTCE